MTHPSGDDGLAHSMTDLMAGVAATFLLLAVIFMVKKTEQSGGAENKVQEMKMAREEAERAIEDLGVFARGLEGMSESADVTKEDKLLLEIVLNRRQFEFASGSCQVASSANDVLSTEFPALLTKVCQLADEKQIQSIVLEGHTDAAQYLRASARCKIPLTHADCSSDGPLRCQAASFQNNVKLSAARAQELFFRMRGSLGRVPSSEGLLRCLDRWFVVSGRGPAEANGQIDERFRRVVVRIRGRVKDAAQ